MSVWTHINCNIRIDSLEIMTASLFGSVKDNLQDKIIGPVYAPFIDERVDLDEIWPTTTNSHELKLPCGSEGSLRVILHKEKDSSAIASHVLTIYGDLRDYDDKKEICEWFKKICEDISNTEISGATCIRQAVCQIEIEGKDHTILLEWKDNQVKSYISYNEEEDQND